MSGWERAIKVGKFIFLVDFFIFDTGWVAMDLEADELTLRIDDEQEKLQIYITIK